MIFAYALAAAVAGCAPVDVDTGDAESELAGDARKLDIGFDGYADQFAYYDDFFGAAKFTPGPRLCHGYVAWNIANQPPHSGDASKQSTRAPTSTTGSPPPKATATRRCSRSKPRRTAILRRRPRSPPPSATSSAPTGPPRPASPAASPSRPGTSRTTPPTRATASASPSTPASRRATTSPPRRSAARTGARSPPATSRRTATCGTTSSGTAPTTTSRPSQLCKHKSSANPGGARVELPRSLQERDRQPRVRLRPARRLPPRVLRLPRLARHQSVSERRRSLLDLWHLRAPAHLEVARRQLGRRRALGHRGRHRPVSPRPTIASRPAAPPSSCASPPSRAGCIGSTSRGSTAAAASSSSATRRARPWTSSPTASAPIRAATATDRLTSAEG